MLQQVGAENQAELIERQHGKIISVAEEGKDAFRDLGDDRIIVEHCETIVAYAAGTQVLGNVIESVARDGIVDVIEPTARPAPWLRIRSMTLQRSGEALLVSRLHSASAHSPPGRDGLFNLIRSVPSSLRL